MAVAAHDDAREAAAVLRRLASLYHAGEIPLHAYRRDRRRVLDALRERRPIPDDLRGNSLVDDVRWRLAVVLAVAALAALVVVLIVAG